MATTIYLGQTVNGIINLRTKDVSTGLISPYNIQSSAVIKLSFPGASLTPGLQGASVNLLSTTAGEVTVVVQNGAQISYSMTPVKSALLFITNAAAVDCIITNPDTTVDIFEAVKIYNIQVVKNP